MIASAIEVHRELGPGLLESVCEICLEEELRLRGFEVKRQVKVPVIY
ncbi:MAG: GxxExxY protein, partial [Saprospiraceae bacterium]